MGTLPALFPFDRPIYRLSPFLQSQLTGELPRSRAREAGRASERASALCVLARSLHSSVDLRTLSGPLAQSICGARTYIVQRKWASEFLVLTLETPLPSQRTAASLLSPVDASLPPSFFFLFISRRVKPAEDGLCLQRRAYFSVS